MQTIEEEDAMNYGDAVGFMNPDEWEVDSVYLFFNEWVGGNMVKTHYMNESGTKSYLEVPANHLFKIESMGDLL